jgi:uncharacterized LabA/DUF88 family protein
MYFIDGENIVYRYQAMVKKGFAPQPNVIYERDSYLWSPQLSTPGNNQIVRAYYYMSILGDIDKIQAISNRIKQFRVQSNVPEGSAKNLYPCVYKKEQRSSKAKGIDIQMTVDILTHVFQNNLDIVCLFSGDGDYRPVLNEAIRFGKHIYIAAFSDGLNPMLRQIADEFINLDSVFFDLSKSLNPA